MRRKFIIWLSKLRLMKIHWVEHVQPLQQLHLPLLALELFLEVVSISSLISLTIDRISSFSATDINKLPALSISLDKLFSLQCRNQQYIKLKEKNLQKWTFVIIFINLRNAFHVIFETGFDTTDFKNDAY